MSYFLPARLIFFIGALFLSLTFSSLLSIPLRNLHPIEKLLESDRASAQKIETFLKKEVPGLNQTYRDIFNMIIDEGHNVWLTGGAVRDLLSKEENVPNDLDFTFDCKMEELERILTINDIPYTKIPQYLVINIGLREGTEMEGIESSYAIHAKDEELEFTVNTIHYHLNSGTFESRFKNGLKDLDEKWLQVKTKDLSKWLYGGQSERPIKIFRFWKMRGKGYQSSPHLERFIVLETIHVFKKDPERFKIELLGYLGSHFSSFDQVKAGCFTTMGSKWCKENLETLYFQAKFMDRHIDALWNKQKVKSLCDQALNRKEKIRMQQMKGN